MLSVLFRGGLTLTLSTGTAVRYPLSLRSQHVWLALHEYVARLDSHTEDNTTGPVLI